MSLLRLSSLIVDVKEIGTMMNTEQRLVIEDKVKKLAIEYNAMPSIDPEELKISMFKLIGSYTPAARGHGLKDILIRDLSTNNIIVLGPEGKYEGKGVFKILGKYALAIGKFAPNTTVSYHRHLMPEYFFILEGSLVFATDDNPANTFTLKANEWKRMDAEVTHGLYSPDGCKCVIITVPPDEDFPEGLADIEKFFADNKSNGGN